VKRNRYIIDLSSFNKKINHEVPRMINIVFFLARTWLFLFSEVLCGFPENLAGVNIIRLLSDGSPSPSVNSVIAGKIFYTLTVTSTSDVDAVFFKRHKLVRVNT